MVVVLGLLSTAVPGTGGRTLSYTEFKQLVRAGDVDAVVISNQRIRGTLKKGDQPIAVIRVDDPSLMADLEQHRVTVTGEIATNWWSSLLWLLPMMLLFFYWTRATQGAGPQGVLSFG